MASWIYDGFINVLWPWIAYYYALRIHCDGKYRTNYRARLGIDLPPRLPPAPRLWLHALSVGEVLASIPLVDQFQVRCPQLHIVYSTATESGQAVAHRYLGANCEAMFFLPHDFPWAMSRLIGRIRPTLFVLVETDVWPNLLSTLCKNNIPALLVNARLSPRSYERMLAIRPATLPLLRSFDLIFTQSKLDHERYRALGAMSQQLVEAGNLKFDLALARSRRSDGEKLRHSLGISRERPVWIAGSIHAGEEQVLLETHRLLLKDFPELLLILAPRHPELGSTISRRCHDLGFSAGRRSQKERPDSRQVFILDTIGELADFYSLADAAFIGGSLVPFGGHNPLEAVVQGIPACWGPHLFNFREIERILIDSGCGEIITGKETLVEALTSWLMDRKERNPFRARSARIFEKHGQASKRIVQQVLARYPLISTNVTTSAYPCSSSRGIGD